MNAREWVQAIPLGLTCPNTGITTESTGTVDLVSASWNCIFDRNSFVYIYDHQIWTNLEFVKRCIYLLANLETGSGNNSKTYFGFSTKVFGKCTESLFVCFVATKSLWWTSYYKPAYRFYSNRFMRSAEICCQFWSADLLSKLCWYCRQWGSMTKRTGGKTNFLSWQLTSFTCIGIWLPYNFVHSWQNRYRLPLMYDVCGH